MTTGPMVAQASTWATTAANSSSRVAGQVSLSRNAPTESGISRKIEPQHRPRNETTPDTATAESSHCREVVNCLRRRENSGIENVMAAEEMIDVGPRRIWAPRSAPFATTLPTAAMTR